MVYTMNYAISFSQLHLYYLLVPETGWYLEEILMKTTLHYTLSEAWSGVNWADLMAAQGAFGTDFYDRSTDSRHAALDGV